MCTKKSFEGLSSDGSVLPATGRCRHISLLESKMVKLVISELFESVSSFHHTIQSTVTQNTRIMCSSWPIDDTVYDAKFCITHQLHVYGMIRGFKSKGYLSVHFVLILPSYLERMKGIIYHGIYIYIQFYKYVYTLCL